MDLENIVKKHILWKRELPRIQPYYGKNLLVTAVLQFSIYTMYAKLYLTRIHIFNPESAGPVHNRT